MRQKEVQFELVDSESGPAMQKKAVVVRRFRLIKVEDNYERSYEQSKGRSFIYEKVYRSRDQL